MKIILFVGVFVVIKAVEYFKRVYIYKKKIKIYQQENKLTSDELLLFKETMAVVKKQILFLESAESKSKALLAIEKKEKGVASAKLIFKELMKEPQAMTELEQFLYRKLPSLVEASEKLVEIQESKLSTSEIEKSKKVILDTISSISASITDDYEAIVQEDSEDIYLSKKLIEGKK